MTEEGLWYLFQIAYELLKCFRTCQDYRAWHICPGGRVRGRRRLWLTAIFTRGNFSHYGCCEQPASGLESHGNVRREGEKDRPLISHSLVDSEGSLARDLL